jgi:farnesyl diphosphate synthase
MGQMLDLVSQPQGRQPRLEDFNLKLYKQIVTYKTAFYTFYLPISSALIMMGFASPENLRVTREVCIAIGVKFQIQDDYLDCYGDPEKIGKIGTDIMDHKCSWLCVQALDRMTNAQLALFKTHYGKHDAESEAQIKQLYKDLDLESLYLKQEESSLASNKGTLGPSPYTVV